uniref:Uncharacterized protein n=1 Tax=Opuntia streptacantha TaxID=393608 RepID=A0A7C9EMQ6_OPUST
MWANSGLISPLRLLCDSDSTFSDCSFPSPRPSRPDRPSPARESSVTRPDAGLHRMYFQEQGEASSSVHEANAGGSWRSDLNTINPKTSSFRSTEASPLAASAVCKIPNERTRRYTQIWRSPIS